MPRGLIRPRGIRLNDFTVSADECKISGKLVQIARGFWCRFTTSPDSRGWVGATAESDRSESQLKIWTCPIISRNHKKAHAKKWPSLLRKLLAEAVCPALEAKWPACRRAERWWPRYSLCYQKTDLPKKKCIGTQKWINHDPWKIKKNPEKLKNRENSNRYFFKRFS